nr:MAG: ORF1 [TTV-like mini virus]
MPWNWYRRSYRRRWRRRRRPYWTRARKTFRRRWRTRFRVRKKLKKLTLKQYQPDCIRKCTIRGMLCLLQCSFARLDHNWTMYENTYAPPHLPNGGGFSIMKISLQNLFDMHSYARNYWSQTNTHLPLVRYCGCKIKLYQSKNLDYIVKTQNSFPFTSGPLTYPSTQPSIMLQTRGSHIIPSKQTEKRKKPYKVIRLGPPKQLQNKWYFQKELANVPLLLFYTAATSLDNFYTDPNKISETLSILSLNTKYFTNRQFYSNPTTGYAAKIEGTIHTYYYAARTNTPDNPNIGDVVALAKTTYYTAGNSFNDLHQTDWNKWKETDHRQHWGNPFYPEYLDDNGTWTLYQSTKDPDTLYKHYTQANMKADQLTRLLDGFVIPVRYNINRDNGQDVQIYLKANNKNELGWDPPNDEDLVLTGLPAWLGLWGFLDYKKKQNVISVDTGNILVIKTTHTQPIRTHIVPLDIGFIKGHSPFEENVNPWDKDKWYPQVQFQEQTINTLVGTGPGTPKLNTKQAEAHALYSFYFKFGGSPGPMSNIENPEHQIQYPLPSNFIQTSPLQNPTQPIELYLQAFDERRGMLTTTATKRMQKDWDSKQSFIEHAGLSMDPEPLQTLQEVRYKTQTQEESEEEILQQLIEQRQQQHSIKLRILQLMEQYKNLE